MTIKFWIYILVDFKNDHMTDLKQLSVENLRLIRPCGMLSLGGVG